MAKLKPQNTIRFAWWGAEELGLIGSTAYVDGLSQEELDRIALYLNYDMVGSPNYICSSTTPTSRRSRRPVDDPGRLDGDRGRVRVVLHDGQRAVRRHRVRRTLRLPGVHRSGIPSGGLFTGAEEVKTAQQQADLGRQRRVTQFDPCYHLACDTFDNNDDHALDVNSDLIAFAQLTFAFSTQSVNGVPGKPVPGSPSSPLPPPQGPKGRSRTRRRSVASSAPSMSGVGRQPGSRMRSACE